VGANVPVLAYVSSDNADLVLAAEVVVESKKPQEVENFKDLAEAMIGQPVWQEKTLPYVRANITKIQYFVLTTFTDFAIVPITTDLRRRFVAVSKGQEDEDTLKNAFRKQTVLFQLRPSLPHTDPRSTAAWREWIQIHFAPSALAPVAISEINNSAPSAQS